MKSISEWRVRKNFNEFVGPQGQIDPIEQNPQFSGVEHLAHQLLQRLSGKSPEDINAFQQHFNTELQQLLVDKKGQGAARNNLTMNKNWYTQAKQQFGRAPTMPSAATPQV